MAYWFYCSLLKVIMCQSTAYKIHLRHSSQLNSLWISSVPREGFTLSFPLDGKPAPRAGLWQLNKLSNCHVNGTKLPTQSFLPLWRSLPKWRWAYLRYLFIEWRTEQWGKHFRVMRKQNKFYSSGSHKKKKTEEHFISFFSCPFLWQEK